MLSITDSNRKWWCLAAMSLALAMVFIDQTSVPVALPQIQRSLNTSSIMLQWIMNSYLLSLAVIVIFGGKVGDIIGHRQAFLLGLVIFVLASILCATAQSATWAIASRALQGIGGAFMIPNSSVIVVNSFEPEKRGKVMGIFVGSAALFIILGPLLGGALTQYLSWRYVFWINFPIAIIAALLASASAPKVLPKNTQVHLDWLGFILFASAIFALVFALMEAVNLGWYSPLILILLAASVVLFTVFIIYELNYQHPLIELPIFKDTYFRAAILLLLVMQIAFIATIFWPIFMQDVLGYSPGMAGLLSVPVVIPAIFMPLVGGKLFDRFGPRLPVTLGAIGIIIATLWVSIFAHKLNYWWIFPGFLLFGFSAPLTVGSAMTTALTTVNLEKRGTASGIASVARQLGSTLGLAVVGSIIANLNKYHLDQFLHQAHGAIAAVKIQQISGLLAGSQHAHQALRTLSQLQLQTLHRVAVHSYTTAFSWGMFAVTLTGVLSLILALQLPNHRLLKQ